MTWNTQKEVTAAGVVRIVGAPSLATQLLFTYQSFFKTNVITKVIFCSPTNHGPSGCDAERFGKILIYLNESSLKVAA
jgi:hypothetical protein